MPRIAIIGAGAIGSVVAALLEENGRHEVFLCIRRPLPDLVVHDESRGRSIQVAARRLTGPEQAAAVDWIMVATKVPHVPDLAPWLRTLGAGAAPMAVLQNGVEHRERFAGLVEPARIVPVVVNCPVERLDPAQVRQRGRLQLKVPATSLGHDFVALFDGTAAEAAAVADFATAAWRKLAFNAAGVMSALAGRPAGVFREADIGAPVLEIVRECLAVGRAEGASLPDSLPEEVLQACRAQAPDSVNSLLADRLAGRPTEIDARNGVVVRLGRKHGLPTPCNEMAVALLRALP
ncbi:MAG TPA: 2-dehydropantoate 2-reductase [Opitutaceae bacterium]|jgi:2-dehydropantoate 2-reductase|nr:2-dehydropantoate 2-reductase [Opitutaceae bacterium]